jgi:hypothetical protein
MASYIAAGAAHYIEYISEGISLNTSVLIHHSQFARSSTHKTYYTVKLGPIKILPVLTILHLAK